MKMPLIALIPFLIVVTLVGGSAMWFTGSRLSSGFASLGWWRSAAWAWAALFWLFPLVGMIFFRDIQNHWKSLSFFFMGVGATTLLLLLLFTLLNVALAWAGKALPDWWSVGVLALGLALGLLGLSTANSPPRVKDVRIEVAGLKPALEGLRIVQVSDLHVSHLLGAHGTQGLVEQVNALKPDMIVLTGDLVEGTVGAIGSMVEPLKGLKAPLGLHYVTGNHEYFWNAPEWVAFFEGLGFDVLTNRHSVVKVKDADLLVVGVNDPTGERMGQEAPDIAKAMAGAPRADFTLLLAHQPNAYPMAEAIGADLMLSGHTHGGQFWPFPPIVALFHKYFKGLYKDGKTWVYVSPGTGFWGPPTRLGVPPEITLLVLTKG